METDMYSLELVVGALKEQYEGLMQDRVEINKDLDTLAFKKTDASATKKEAVQEIIDYKIAVLDEINNLARGLNLAIETVRDLA